MKPTEQRQLRPERDMVLPLVHVLHLGLLISCSTVCLAIGGVNTVKRKSVGRPKLPTTEKRAKRLAVNLTTAEYTALTREARRRGESVSDLTRGLVQRFLARAGKTPR